MAAGACLLVSGPAWAQTAGDVNKSPHAQAAYADWRRLSQTEVNCVDRSLRGQGSSLWLVIQRGVGPSNPTLAKVRAACGTQTAGGRSGSQALASAVDSALDKAVAEKAAAEKAAAEKAAADKAAADKVAADKAAAEKAAADKAAADKAVAEKAAADKAAADKAAAKAAADKAAADNAARDLADAEAERAKVQAAKAKADVERSQGDAEKKPSDMAFAYSAAESRISFIYGLMIGPMLFGFGGAAFLLMQRRRRATDVPSEPSKTNDVDQVVAAVLAELDRRDRKTRKAAALEQPAPAPARSDDGGRRRREQARSNPAAGIPADCV